MKTVPGFRSTPSPHLSTPLGGKKVTPSEFLFPWPGLGWTRRRGAPCRSGWERKGRGAVLAGKGRAGRQGPRLPRFAPASRARTRTSSDTDWVNAPGLGSESWGRQDLPRAPRPGRGHATRGWASSSGPAGETGCAQRSVRGVDYLSWPERRRQVLSPPRDSQLTGERTCDSERLQFSVSHSKKLFLWSPEGKDSQNAPLHARLSCSALWES